MHPLAIFTFFDIRSMLIKELIAECAFNPIMIVTYMIIINGSHIFSIAIRKTAIFNLILRAIFTKYSNVSSIQLTCAFTLAYILCLIMIHLVTIAIDKIL